MAVPGLLDLAPTGGAPLYDMAARFYAPSVGAFTQADTVAGSSADPASMNRFLYAQANPTTLVDPSGHYATVCDPGDGCSPDGRRVTRGRGGTGRRGGTATPSTHTHGNSGVNASSVSRPPVLAPAPVVSPAWGVTLPLEPARPAETTDYRFAGGCLGVSGQVGIMGGIAACLVDGDLQVQFIGGGSTGVGATLYAGPVVTNVSAPAKLAGWGGGFGASVVPGVGGGIDSSYSKPGDTVHTVNPFLAVGIVDSPEFGFIPAEANAYGSYTLDINDAVRAFLEMDSFWNPGGGRGSTGGGF